MITQKTLFDYMEIEDLGDLERLYLCLDGINNKQLIKKLNNERKNGRNDYPNEVMLNLVIAMKIFGHRTVESFRRELSRNSQLRKACGLTDYDYLHKIRKKLIPNANVFTNFFNKLIKHQDELNKIFEESVSYMYDNIKDFGNVLAGDGKYINSYAKRKNKNEDLDNRSEQDAEYSIKDQISINEKGEKKSNRKIYYGFRVHTVVDADTELPIMFKVEKANTSENIIMKEFIPLLKGNYLTLDRGYDDKKIIELCNENNIKPVIHNRIMREKESIQYKDTNIYYYESGKVEYYDEDKKEFKEMIYKGYDKNRNALRYEYNNKVYRILCKEDPRVFNVIPRDSKKFKKIYNKRTSVERYHSRLDRDYMFEDHTVRGLKKMTLMVSLTNIIMLAMAKAHLKKKNSNIASLVKI